MNENSKCYFFLFFFFLTEVEPKIQSFGGKIYSVFPKSFPKLSYFFGLWANVESENGPKWIKVRQISVMVFGKFRRTSRIYIPSPLRGSRGEDVKSWLTNSASRKFFFHWQLSSLENIGCRALSKLRLAILLAEFLIRSLKIRGIKTVWAVDASKWFSSSSKLNEPKRRAKTFEPRTPKTYTLRSLRADHAFLISISRT